MVDVSVIEDRAQVASTVEGGVELGVFLRTWTELGGGVCPSAVCSLGLFHEQSEVASLGFTKSPYGDLRGGWQVRSVVGFALKFI